jgi:hypothetical protein
MRLIFGLTLLASLAGCKKIPDNVRGCYGDGCAIVTTSKYNPDFTGVGTLNTVKFPDRTIVNNLDTTLDPDVALAVQGNDLWVLNRSVGSLRRYDVATMQVELEIPLGTPQAPGPLSAPRDFAVDPAGKAWVSFGGNPAGSALGIVNLYTGTLKYVALPAASGDPDGAPEAGDVYQCKNHVYVALQDYTFAGGDFRYVGPGRIAVVDLSSDTLDAIIQLKGKNPSQILAAGNNCEQALVLDSSGLTTVPDGTGGIERVDLAARTSMGWLATDMQLGGRPSNAVRISESLMATSIYFDPQTGQDGKVYLSSVKVVAVDPSTGAKGADLLDKAGFVNFVELSPDKKELFVGTGQFFDQPEPGKLAKGLYVGPADGTKIPSTRIDLGETPSAIAFHKF